MDAGGLFDSLVEKPRWCGLPYEGAHCHMTVKTLVTAILCNRTSPSHNSLLRSVRRCWPKVISTECLHKLVPVGTLFQKEKKKLISMIRPPEPQNNVITSFQAYTATT